MRRRDFITLIGSATALPFVARAQQKSMPVIGYLSVGSPQLQHPFVVAFHEGLKEAGFVAGENLTIEYRWAEERYERLPRLAADLVGRKVEVIVATGELPLRVSGKRNLDNPHRIHNRERPGPERAGCQPCSTGPKHNRLHSDRH